MDLFYAMDCLTEHSALLKGIDVQKRHLKAADKRIIAQYLQKFVQYNQKALDFLGVQAWVTGTDLNAALQFSASSYIGCVPLRASDTGKQIGDFVVKPRYINQQQYDEFLEILHLLGHDISPEFLDGLTLSSGHTLRPPQFLEAIKFIDLLHRLSGDVWQKFAVIQREQSTPSGKVNWDKYAKQSAHPEKALMFPQRNNSLTENHAEYAKLHYVFDLCRSLLTQAHLPNALKRPTQQKVDFLTQRLAPIAMQTTRSITIKNSDKPLLQACKKQANIILQNQAFECLGWRLDVAEIFERYVQYVFTELANITGARLHKNVKIPGQFKKQSAWELKYLEPDAIYQKEHLMVVIDAKYKSHFYHLAHDSEALKEEHRRDLHQILAYSAFNHSPHKSAILCYPAQYFQHKTMLYTNPANNCSNKVIMLGLPMSITLYKNAKQAMIELLQQLETDTVL